MRGLSYVVALVPGLFCVLGLLLGGPLVWVTPLVVFGLVPLADTVWRRSGSAGPGSLDGAAAHLLLVLSAVLDLLAVGLLVVRAPALGPVELAGCVVSVGIVLGVYGLNVGHELGHRGGRAFRLTAWVLMASSLYGHFWIEHNLGHHARVATPEDPASARRGQWLYPFWVQSIVGGARSALALAPRFVLGIWLAQALAVAAVAIGLGPVAALAWLGAAAIGILLLETVNYLEHYGLVRERTADGRWERVQPRHSWNAEHPVGRAMLFDLPRHADHHANPRRACIDLRPFDEAPQLPVGYPAMVLIALVPPLFMALMHPRLDQLGSLAPLSQRAARG